MKISILSLLLVLGTLSASYAMDADSPDAPKTPPAKQDPGSEAAVPEASTTGTETPKTGKPKKECCSIL